MMLFLCIFLGLIFTTTQATQTYLPCKEVAAQFEGSTRLIGSFVPQCQKENNLLYESLQCHGSIGMCVCVDQVTGEHISNAWRLTKEEYTNRENICAEKNDLKEPSI